MRGRVAGKPHKVFFPISAARDPRKVALITVVTIIVRELNFVLAGSCRFGIFRYFIHKIPSEVEVPPPHKLLTLLILFTLLTLLTLFALFTLFSLLTI